MKIGDVTVTILSESPTYSQSVTDRPVEGGSIVDNVTKNPVILNVSGLIPSNGWEGLKLLRSYVQNGELVKYSGRNVFSNFVIENLTTGHGYQTKGGFTFTATLKEVRQARFVEVPFTAPIKSAGVKVPVNKRVDNEKALEKVNKQLAGTGQEVALL
jgi:hypothetical protein